MSNFMDRVGGEKSGNSFPSGNPSYILTGGGDLSSVRPNNRQPVQFAIPTAERSL